MNTDRAKRRGISLMMVTAVVAVASVMGMAILSSNTLQAEASASHDHAVGADALAESGVNLGMYYLQNLTDASKCPAGLMSQAVGGQAYMQNGNSLGTGVLGTFDLSITRPRINQYQITAVGKATAGTAVQRTLKATVDVNYWGYGINAPNTTAALTIPANTTVTGDVYSKNGATNNGGLVGALFGLVGAVGNLVSDVTTQVPGTGSVNHYLTYTNINGKTGTATLIVLPTLSNTTLGPTLANPGGVYYYIGNLDLLGNVKVNGTLVLSGGGSLRAQGTGNSITPLANFPAAVIEGDINMRNGPSSLDVNGLTYVGGSITKSGSAATYALNIVGTLLFAGGTPTIDPGVLLNVKYDRTKNVVTSLVSNPKPTSLSIVSWKN